MAKKKPIQADLPASTQPLRLEYRAPADLDEHPSNWRKHPERQVKALQSAIDQVGWAGAILLNERTGRILDGHARKKVAIARGDKAVPILIGNWTEEQERLILASVDPIGAMAETDKDALERLLGEVHATGDLADMLRTFGDDELHVSGDGGLENPDIKPETVRPAPSMTWVLVGVPLTVWGAAQEHVAALQKLAEQHQGLSVQSNRD